MHDSVWKVDSLKASPLNRKVQIDNTKINFGDLQACLVGSRFQLQVVHRRHTSHVPDDIRSFHTWVPQWHDLPAGSWLAWGPPPEPAPGFPHRGPLPPSTPLAQTALCPPPAQLHPLCPRRRLSAGFRPWGCCEVHYSTVYSRWESSLRSPAAQRDQQNQGQPPELRRDASSRRRGPLGCARAMGPGVHSRNQRSGSCLSKHERGNRPVPAPPGPGVAGTWLPGWPPLGRALPCRVFERRCPD